MSDAIRDFWVWWDKHRSEFETEDPLEQSLRDRLSEQVAAIDPDLCWEVGQMELAVTGEQSFALRKIAQRWLDAAPANTHGWKFLAARPGLDSLTLVLKFGGQKLPMLDVEFVYEVDPARARVDVALHHPAFAKLPGNDGIVAAYILLNTLLGEDSVESWIGSIAVDPESPPSPQTAAELRDEVRELQQRTRPSEVHYSLLDGEAPDGNPYMACLALGLKRLEHLDHEWHVEVELPYDVASEEGMPDERSHSTTSELEDDLLETVSEANLVHYGHVIYAGSLRVLFYAADRERAEQRLREWMTNHEEVTASAKWEHDPEWDLFQRF
jgi:hypothetical protein